jgi:carbohydrate-selective porin OprB
MKIFAGKVRVGKQTLKRYFKAFNRVFQQNHYCFPELLTVLAICKIKLHY